MKPTLDFESFSIDSLQKFLPYIRKNTSLAGDISAGYLYMWHKDTNVRFCVFNNTFAVCQLVGGQSAFSYPIGEDPDGMIDQLKQYAFEHHLPLRFFAVDERELDLILGDGRLQPAMWAYDRRWSDYLYHFEDARDFRGKKYSGQRNHINKFKKLYGEPCIRLLTADDEPRVAELLKSYAAEHQDGRALEKTELERTKDLYRVYDRIGLICAGLFAADKLVAFSIGEIAKNALLIHVEKALKQYEGAYPAMYSGFVRLIAEQASHPLQYVNREDDSGDEGLRTSKMQYHPTALIHKRLVHIASPAAKVKPNTVLPAGGVVLTEIRESDKAAYLRLNTDVQNNRYWGYDYREDIGISEPITENTFFDSVMIDMRAGDSVNFAIRTSENSEMAGEALLWNFTFDGIAEIGCRLLPAYQGKGYGKAAFGALADFAEEHLKVKVITRCHRENTPSRRMITASGFSQVRTDGDYCVFERKKPERAV